MRIRLATLTVELDTLFPCELANLPLTQRKGFGQKTVNSLTAVIFGYYYLFHFWILTNPAEPKHSTALLK